MGPVITIPKKEKETNQFASSKACFQATALKVKLHTSFEKKTKKEKRRFNIVTLKSANQ
jgi:hypothetical protein